MFFRRSLSHLFTFTFTLAFIQIPAFIAVYEQRLGGHIDELNHQIRQLERLALLSSQSLSAYIDKFLMHADLQLVHQGLFMQRIVEREERLKVAFTEIQTSSLLLKPFFFLKNLDMEIAWNCLRAFQPGIALTLEGLCYAIMGVVFSSMLISFATTAREISTKRCQVLAKSPNSAR